MEIEPVAHIRTQFPTKFGVPRQAGLAQDLVGTIVFEPDYRAQEALRGIEGFSHLWLIWGFSHVQPEQRRLVVRPPRLGGNERVGVFATRSPYRPNGLGLSCVELAGVEEDPGGHGLVLHVRGADLVDGTPIYDIKPYLPYADAHPDATSGFSIAPERGVLTVECAPELLELVGDDAAALVEVLARDPRPAYHADRERVYEMDFAEWEVRFRVSDDVLTVTSIDSRR